MESHDSAHRFDDAPPHPGWRGALACLFAVTLAALVYLNTLNNPFVFDDFQQVVENRSLTSPNVHALVFQNVTRPVLNLSFVIDRQLWGPEPFGFHVTNTVLHLVNVALLFWLAWRWASFRNVGRPVGAALGAAILLAVHPMMTMAVGYVSGRSEVMCATFFLLALASADRWFRGGHEAWRAAVVGFWFLALGTKEIAIAFPIVLIFCDRWIYSGDQTDRSLRWWQLHLPLCLLALLGGVARVVVLEQVQSNVAPELHWDLVLVELDVWRRYFWMMIAPGGQAIFHAIPPVTGLFDPRVLIACAVILAIVAVAWVLHARMPTVGFGLLWFFLILVPSSLLVAFDRAEPMAEHRVYLASAGLFLGLGASFDWMVTRRRTRRSRLMLEATLAAAVLLLTMQAFIRTLIWSDPIALWSEAAQRSPDHWLPYIPLGEALHASGRHDEAVAALRRSLQLRPEEHQTLGKLGVCLVETGQLADAAQTFERLRAVDPETPEVAYGLGLIALASGDVDGARSRWQEVLRVQPLNVAARQALARLEETQDPASALRWCDEIRQIAPDTPGNADCIERNQRRVGGAVLGP